jgi:hypothetical protein
VRAWLLARDLSGTRCAKPSTQARQDEHQRTAFFKQLDNRRQIITRQLALEAWLADWSAAEA